MYTDLCLALQMYLPEHVNNLCIKMFTRSIYKNSRNMRSVSPLLKYPADFFFVHNFPGRNTVHDGIFSLWSNCYIHYCCFLERDRVPGNCHLNSLKNKIHAFIH